MNTSTRADHLLAQLDHLNAQQLRRLLVEHLTRQKLGLYWEANAIERDAALNANLVLPRLVEKWSYSLSIPGEDVGRVSPSGNVLAHGNVGLRDEAANPIYAIGKEGISHRNLIIEGDNYDSLRMLRARLREWQMDMEFTEAALDKLGEAGFDAVYGARPLKRAIQQAVEKPLSKKILSGEFVPGDVILVDVSGGELGFGKSERRAALA